MTPAPLIYVVDDDVDLATSLARLLERSGYRAAGFAEPAEMLEACGNESPHCVVSDVMMEELDGFVVAERLREISPATAIIFMTAWPQTSAAVDAIRSFRGVDYLEKPIEEQRLLDGLAQGVGWSERRRMANARLNTLTAREWDVFKLLASGLSNKMLAAELGIKPKTVEDHRAAIMEKTRSRSVADLVELWRDIERHP